MLHSIKILSNDIISTALSDKLYFPHTKISLNPRRVPILSSNTKLICGPGVNISTILPNVKFGDSEWIISFSVITFFNNNPFNFIIQTFDFVSTR